MAKTFQQIVLFLCLITKISAELAFKDTNDLENALKNLKEDTKSGSLLGFITCENEDAPNDKNGIKISINPGVTIPIDVAARNRYRTGVVLKNALDFETASDFRNAFKVTFSCEKTGLVTKTLDLYITVQDVNDNAPTFVKSGGTNDSYVTSIDEIINIPNPSEGLEIYDAIKVTDIDGVDNSAVTPICVGLTSTPVYAQKLNCNDFFRLTSVLQKKDDNGTTYQFKLFAMKEQYKEYKSFTLDILAMNVPSEISESNPVLNSTSQNLVINVLEVQDSPPAFLPNSLRKEIFEDMVVGSVINSTIKAYDLDVGGPNPVAFELLSNPTSVNDGYQYFELGQVFKLTGEIYYEVELILKKPIDREQIIDNSKNVQVKIKAYETNIFDLPNRNPMNQSAVVTVNVKDVNDITPTFNFKTYTIIVNELQSGVLSGSTQLVVQEVSIQVTDNDGVAFNTFNLTILPSSFSNLFFLDAYQGSGSQIFTLNIDNSVLDFENNQPNEMSITLKAVDIDKPLLTSTAVVNVFINDLNDNDPQFTQDSYSFSFAEDKPVGYFVGRVSATDGDSGLSGQISSYKISESSNTFIIDNEGNIILNKTVDYEILNVYQFTVTAWDSDPQNRKEATITVTVNITNVVDTGPQIVGVYITQVFEESVDLQPKIIVKADTREQQSGIVFSVQSVIPTGLNMNEYFFLNPSTGQFSLNKPINFRNTNRGLIRVLVRAASVGRADLFSEKYINITVVNLNNHPPVFKPIRPDNTYYAQIRESAPRDNESTTVKLSGNNPLIFLGFVVIKLNTTDADEEGTPGGTVSYQILSGANDDFAIDGTSGVITVGSRARLDADDGKAYSIVVRALDKGNPSKSAEATVVISLLDANNKNPIFSLPLYQFQVNESQAISSPIGTVSATDPDSNNRIRYSLLFASATLESKGVIINNPTIDLMQIIEMEDISGIIRVKGIITREFFDRIEIKAQAIDIAGESQVDQITTAVVVITVVASLDPDIKFELPWTRQNPVYTIPQPESDTRNTGSIFKLRATDPSKSATIVNFRKIRLSDPGDYFNIQSSSVVLKKALDFETLPGSGSNTKIVSVVVEAISSDNLRTSTATLIFQVSDVNDNAPIFEQTEYTADLKENSIYPVRVVQLSVTDKDSGSYGVSDFSLEGAQDKMGRDLFFVERGSRDNLAVIRVAEGAVLDYEEDSVYNLLVTATDNNGGESGLQTSVTVRINLEDVNDNSPQFTQQVYEFPIIDTTGTGETVGQVAANDRDKGSAGQVVYSIQSGPGRPYFNIETDIGTSHIVGQVQQIGRIFVVNSLSNLPDRRVFNLTVEARDRGSPVLSNTTTVLVTISKAVEDPKPKWDINLPTRVMIPEGSPNGTYVATITASSASRLTYSLVTNGNEEGDHMNYKIDPNTGEILTNAELDFEEQKIYQLLILATDTTNSTLKNQYLLVVEITDIDDNDPTFQNCRDRKFAIPTIARVMESEAEDVFVYKVDACDDDESPNNDVAYRPFIPTPGSQAASLCQNQDELFGAVFSLNSLDGVIRTLVSLDRERIPDYLLCVQAIKRSQLRKKRGVRDTPFARSLHDVLFLKVIVLDANDNGPEFDNRLVKKVILSYPSIDISTAEATDADLAPYNGIRYTIEDIEFFINGIKYRAPAAFTINGNDGTLSAGTMNYEDYVGGYFEITVKAEDYNGGNSLIDKQTQKIYVTEAANQIRVVLNKPADGEVKQDIDEMIGKLNSLQEGIFYEVKKISYHVVNNEQDPLFDKTDVCMVVVRDDNVLTALDATKFLEQQNAVNNILDDYGAREPGPCDPAKSVYPKGWDSYWWVLVAFAIFIFVCVLILIFIILSLYSGYKRYMDTRRTYLVPGN